MESVNNQLMNMMSIIRSGKEHNKQSHDDINKVSKQKPLLWSLPYPDFTDNAKERESGSQSLLPTSL